MVLGMKTPTKTESDFHNLTFTKNNQSLLFSFSYSYFTILLRYPSPLQFVRHEKSLGDIHLLDQYCSPTSLITSLETPNTNLLIRALELATIAEAYF